MNSRLIFHSRTLVEMKEALRAGEYKKYLLSKFDVPLGLTVNSTTKVPAHEVSFKFESGNKKTIKRDSPENAIAIFEAYGSLTAEDATDERFWAYLTHVDFFEYMQQRTNIVGQSTKKRAKYIMDHWFVDPMSPASLMNNDIARLWWVVFLTKTENSDDPYVLTREAFSMLDYTTHLLPGTQGRSPEIRHAVLNFVVSNPKLFSKGKEAKVRFIMRKLNIWGGFSVLSYLSKEQIDKMLGNLIPEIEKISRR